MKTITALLLFSIALGAQAANYNSHQLSCKVRLSHFGDTGRILLNGKVMKGAYRNSIAELNVNYDSNMQWLTNCLTTLVRAQERNLQVTIVQEDNGNPQLQLTNLRNR